MAAAGLLLHTQLPNVTQTHFAGGHQNEISHNACCGTSRTSQGSSNGNAAGPCSRALTPAVTARDQPDGSRWVGTWSASPEAANAPIHFNAQTIRQIVHTSLGGDRVRVRLSNTFGTESLVIGAAHVALSAGGAAIFPGTGRVLTFNGEPASRFRAVPWW